MELGSILRNRTTDMYYFAITRLGVYNPQPAGRSVPVGPDSYRGGRWNVNSSMSRPWVIASSTKLTNWDNAEAMVNCEKVLCR
jgi:hypothetical protein